MKTKEDMGWKQRLVALGLTAALLGGGGVAVAQPASAASCGAGCVTTFTGTAKVGRTITIGGQAGQAGTVVVQVKDERGISVLTRTIKTVKNGRATYSYKFPASSAGHKYHALLTFKNTSGRTLKQVWTPWTLKVAR